RLAEGEHALLRLADRGPFPTVGAGVAAARARLAVAGDQALGGGRTVPGTARRLAAAARVRPDGSVQAGPDGALPQVPGAGDFQGGWPEVGWLVAGPRGGDRVLGTPCK